MGFQQGLSGLNAASRGLDVIGHNIANANTTGMKSSRAEFAELYAASISGASSATAGIGVEVGAISQQFTQGNISITGNNLDVAINGRGFFQVTMSDGTTAYTRAGNFKLDKDGGIVTNTGAQLMGYATDEQGVRTSTTLQPMTLPTGGPIPAKQTSTITAELNLDARAPIWDSVTPTTPLTTYGTSLLAFDSQGVEIPVSLYFRRIGPNTNNDWEVFTDPTDDASATASLVTTLSFDANGKLISPLTPVDLPLTSPNPLIGALTPVPQLDLTAVTQQGIAFAVSDLRQDGYTAGELTGINIEDNGVITARYSNGQSQAAGQIALAEFRNVQGLQPEGGGYWLETFASGQPVRGAPEEGKFGALRSGALEDSNVDLTQELVNMMTAQRTYQANAQTIKTQDQILSTLVNLR
jgi:flagellar hook protein FlgE